MKNQRFQTKNMHYATTLSRHFLHRSKLFFTFPEPNTFLPLTCYSKTKTNWQLWAELEPSSTMPNFHKRSVFFVMDSIILHIILKVNKLNLFHSILYEYIISI